MFGGHGSRKMLTIAKRVAAAGLKTQLIFMCGHNQHLRDQLMALELPFPFHIEGFTREIPAFHESCGLLRRQTGAGQYQRGAGDAPAGDRRAQFVDDGAGALQHRLDHQQSRRRGAAFVRRDCDGDCSDARSRAAGAISRARRRAQQSRDFRNSGNPRHHHRAAPAPDSSRRAAHDVMAGSLADESQRRARKLGREYT